MKISHKEITSLADTTKATSIQKVDDEIQGELLGRHPMALVIEDDELSEINVISELKNIKFLYKTAKTVNEGIEIYKNLDKQGIKIDVLFLDIILKDKSSGIEFLKIIRNNNWMENTFIIVMSSLEDEKVIKECYKYKIKNFLKKPIKKRDLKKEEQKIIKYLKTMECPIDGYNIIKLLDKEQDKESHLVRNIKTKKFFFLQKFAPISNNDNLILNELNNEYKCSTIVSMIEHKILNKNNYFIVEYAEFGSLGEKILKKKEELNMEKYQKEDYSDNFKQMFDTEQILIWITEIIFALYSLHEKKIIHKNIKAERIYIFSENLVKIENLSLARINQENKTDFNSVIYLPPEMFSFQEFTSYTDIWALGIILYELVMLEKPFQGVNIDEIKNNIINEKYKPFPKNIDKRLKRLLVLTLTFINHRASASRLLELKFIRDKLDYLYKNHIIHDDDLYKKISTFPIRDEFNKFNFEKKISKIESKDELNMINYNFLNLKHISEQLKPGGKNINQRARSCITIPKLPKLAQMLINHRNTEEYKEYDYYKLFKNLMYIIYLFPKKNVSKDFFSSSEELIEEYYIRNLDEEYGLIDEDIHDLIELKYLSEKKINNKKFFSYELLKDKNIDNSINFPVEPQYLEYLSEPVTLSCKILLKIKDVFDDFRYLLENELVTEKDKIKIITSKKLYNTYTCIKLLSKLKIDKLSSKEKLSFILNIYQIMSFHLIIKEIIKAYSKSNNNTEVKKSNILNEFKNFIKIILPWNKNPTEVRYNICDNILTLYELKHLVIRRNRPPPYKFFKLVNNFDPRIHLLDGSWEEFSLEKRLKILCLCFDPIDISDDKVNEIIQPLGICFNDNTFEKDLDNSFYLFVKENIWIDKEEEKIYLPFFIKEYLFDLDYDEKRVINIILKELYKEPYLQNTYKEIEKKVSNKKIGLIYYKEYDRIKKNM